MHFCINRLLNIVFWCTLSFVVGSGGLYALVPELNSKTLVETLYYDVYKDKKFMFNVDFSIGHAMLDSKAITYVSTQVSGNSVHEKNIVILSRKLKKVLYIFQHTENFLDKTYFEWTVDNLQPLAVVEYDYLRSEKVIERYFKFPADGYSLQSLLYLFQTLDYSVGKGFEFRLLVPPNYFYKFSGTIIGEEIIYISGEAISCFKMQLSLAGFLGFVTPKFYFWLGKTFPHVPYQYQDTRFIYKLRRMNGSLRL